MTTSTAGRPASNGSKTSKASRTSGHGYKTVSKQCYVDEALFGDGKKSVGKKTAPNDVKNFGNHSPEVFTLSRTQLNKMLEPSPVMTTAEIQAVKREKEAKLRDTRAQAQARKERMLQMEEERKKRAPKTETELIKEDEDGATLARAKHLLEEELDDVKNMNQMMLYSKCVTIRDAQIEEKKHMMLEAEEEDRRLDLMMEIERLKALENYEVAEVQRAEERRRGADVLSKQIEDRERERVKVEEIRNLERVHMLREIERLKEEEIQSQVKRKAAAERMMEEVALANNEQIKRKEVMKVREKEEDARIAEYIRQKEIREQEIVAEKERIAKEKELEVARLRAQQEKAADKQAELDELRARRYQEAKEREWRAREMALKDRQRAIVEDLAQAREAQKAAKIRQLADMARVEKQEFERVLDANRLKEHEEYAKTAAQLDANLKYKEELLAQVAANEDVRLKKQQEEREEGRRLLDEAAREKARLEVIKQRKLRELEHTGVPAKYRAELQKKKIGQW